jgi:hypothetical protein
MVCDWKTTGKSEIAVYLRGIKSEVAFTGKKPGVWHRSVIQLKGDRMTLHVDKELVGETKLSNAPASGPIALTGDGPMQFRNVFVRELK